MHAQAAAFTGRRQPGFFEHALQPFPPALRLAGILPGNIAADIIFFFYDKFLLSLVFLKQAQVARFALLQVGAVIAAENIHAGGHFPDRAGHLVQEITVVRHNQHRPIPILKVRLQPFDRGNVQVVGWLVHQQQIRA